MTPSMTSNSDELSNNVVEILISRAQLEHEPVLIPTKLFFILFSSVIKSINQLKQLKQTLSLP